MVSLENILKYLPSQGLTERGNTSQIFSWGQVTFDTKTCQGYKEEKA